MKENTDQKHEVPRLIYYPELKRLTDLSRSTVWKLEQAGKFPRRRLVTESRVAWLEAEVRQWIEGRAEVQRGEAEPKHNLPKARKVDL